MKMDKARYLERLRVFGEANDVPNITRENAVFLGQMMDISKPQKLLEIGTANGVSAINFGLKMQQWGGKITTIDFSEKSHKEAKEHFKSTGLESTIDAILGNALDIIPNLNDSYDFVFIDGMKRRTVDFLNLVWDKTVAGGIIIIDDVIKFRDKMTGLDEYLERHNITYSELPIDKDDGIILIVK